MGPGRKGRKISTFQRGEARALPPVPRRSFRRRKLQCDSVESGAGTFRFCSESEMSEIVWVRCLRTECFYIWLTMDVTQEIHGVQTALQEFYPYHQ